MATTALAYAQQAKKIPRIGFLSGRVDPNSTAPDPNFAAFQQGLRDLGYVDGENISIELHYADGKQDRVPSIVKELVQSKVDVIVTPMSPAIRVAKKETKTIPIVMITLIDPVANGLVDSLARPGGNVTGLTRLTRELSGKRLELFKEAVPALSRVGILRNVDNQASSIGVKDYESAAGVQKIQLQMLSIRESNPDFESAFKSVAKDRLNGLITVSNFLFLSHRNQIADLAKKYRLPSLFEGGEYVDAGGLMSYATSDPDSFRRAAYYVDKILKGAKPADLPVEQPMKFEFVVNLKTAKQIGLTIPPDVLARANQVIKDAPAKAGGR
jgi:putative ABC transport system substrate-binding protein